MSSGATKLCTIHNHTVYGDLDHHGHGKIWVDNSPVEYDLIIFATQILTIIPSMLLLPIFIKLGFYGLAIEIILLGGNILPLISGREIYSKAVWRVNSKRSLFSIAIPRALKCAAEYINKIQRKEREVHMREIVEKENEKRAKLMMVQIRETLEGLQF